VIKISLNKNIIIYLLVISIIMKFTILFVMSAKPFLDGLGYIGIAKEIFENNFLYPNDQLIDAPITPYIYSIFVPLSKFMGINAYAVPNILLSTATIYIVYLISLEVFENKIIANITAIVTTFYPFFNFYSISILTETIYIFFLYLSLLFGIRFIKNFKLKNLLLFTLFFTIDTLTRFQNLAIYPFVLILFIYFAYKNKKKILPIIAIFSVTFVLVMTPWWLRNMNLFGKFVLTSQGYSGHVFYAGNNPLNKSGGGIGGVDVDYSQFDKIKDLDERDKAEWKAGIEWIKNNPLDWVVLEFRKFKRFFSLTFFAPQYNKWYYNLVSIMSYGVILILFLYSLFFIKPYFKLLSIMFLYSILTTGIYMVFIASIRYRLPLEPFMIIVASYGIYKLLKYE
jgi:hypothetical protein